MMRFALEAFGYNVIDAAGPYDAIEKAEELRPDLILMDIGMPLLDGLSAAQLIGGRAGCENIPIIVLTAYRNIREQALAAGCVDVIYKPVDLDKLKALLATHLN